MPRSRRPQAAKLWALISLCASSNCLKWQNVVCRSRGTNKFFRRKNCDPAADRLIQRGPPVRQVQGRAIRFEHYPAKNRSNTDGGCRERVRDDDHLAHVAEIDHLTTFI